MAIDNIFYNMADSTMYYTTPQGTINTITLDTSDTINTSSWTGPNSTYTIDNTSVWDTYQGYFRNLKEFEDTMPDLTKVKEMCKMYPALDKAFENFKAIYDLTKDDYEARKSNDS